MYIHVLTYKYALNLKFSLFSLAKNNFTQTSPARLERRRIQQEAKDRR